MFLRLSGWQTWNIAASWVQFRAQSAPSSCFLPCVGICGCSLKRLLPFATLLATTNTNPMAKNCSLQVRLPQTVLKHVLHDKQPSRIMAKVYPRDGTCGTSSKQSNTNVFTVGNKLHYHIMKTTATMLSQSNGFHIINCTIDFTPAKQWQYATTNTWWAELRILVLKQD